MRVSTQKLTLSKLSFIWGQKSLKTVRTSFFKSNDIHVEKLSIFFNDFS